MDKIVYRFSLDCQRSGAQRFIEGLVQGEVSNRQLVISLTQNGESVTLADNNLVAVMNCHEVSHPCEIKDNKVIYDFQPSDYAIAGESIYQLMIMTAESPRRVLYTPSFYVNVQDRDGDLVGTDEEYSALQEAIRKAEVVYETRLIGITYEDDGSLIFRFADGRELPIDTLKEVLEQERDREQRFGEMWQDYESWTATEDARQSAERERALAERIRVNDEYQRDDNEGNRQADEQLRHEAERERKKAEAKREETTASYLEDMSIALNDASVAINKMNEILNHDFPTTDDQMEWTEAYEKVRYVRKSEVDYLHGITANTSFSGGTIADKFDSVYARANSIEATHSAYEQRMDGVVDQMNSRIGENSYKTNSLDTRVTRLEQSDVPIATTSVAGKVKPDGSTITVDADGTIHAVGGGGGTSDYNALTNKPSINGITLDGDLSGTDLGLQSLILVDDKTIVKDEYDVLSVSEDITNQVDTNKRNIDMLYNLTQGIAWNFEDTVQSGIESKPSGAKYESLVGVVGDTKQTQYEGYNLLNARLTTSKVISGVTVSMPSSTVIHISGKNETESTVNIWIGFLMTEDKAINVSADNPITIAFWGNDKGTVFNVGNIGNLNTNSPLKRTATINSFRFGCSVNIPPNVDFDDDYYVMLEKGTVVHDYEPYVGGIPSPSPEYPQEIKGVEELNFKITGRNIFDYANYDGSKKYYLNSSCTTAGRSNTDVGIAIQLPKNKTYTISFPYAISRFRVGCVKSLPINHEYEWTTSSVISSAKVNADGKNTAVITTNDECEYMVINISSLSDFNSMNIEYGTTATPYEPYHEVTRKIIPPFTLHRLGDSEDLMDGMDVVSGTWTNATEVNDVPFANRYSVAEGTLYRSGKVYGIERSHKIYCSHYRGVLNSSARKNFAAYYNATADSIDVLDDRFESVAEFNRYITENNVKFLMAIPVGYPIIDDSDLEWIREHLDTADATNTVLTVTDQDGNDVTYMVKYIVKTSEAITTEA